MPKFTELVEAARTMGELREGDAQYVLDLWKQSDECRETEPEDAVVAELRVRLDGWLRKIIFGTGILIIAMVLGAWIAHLTR